jgi:hypothetical protein
MAKITKDEFENMQWFAKNGSKAIALAEFLEAFEIFVIREHERRKAVEKFLNAKKQVHK